MFTRSLLSLLAHVTEVCLLCQQQFSELVQNTSARPLYIIYLLCDRAAIYAPLQHLWESSGTSASLSLLVNAPYQ
jgi:hypothetical protein